ncbi:hypothetical protein K439DRAFT_1507019 [Ramaria rubella]|nr:hypothetical protein K439DRAFT_1507019 [Ramaria rubella]
MRMLDILIRYCVGAEQMRPPTTTCLKPECNQQKLVDERRTEGQLFTLRRGVLPIWAVSSYCKKCNTRYHSNYSVTTPSAPDAIRSYYYNRDIPIFIQVTGHSYIEAALCRFIETEMAFSHASAQSIARVYNLVLKSCDDDVPNKSTFLQHSLDGELVLDSFFLHALLRHKIRCNERLRVPHHGMHEDRLTGNIQERNMFIAGTGQEMWAHACNDCEKFYTGQDNKIYRMTAGVTDGVTIGHPCCQVHDCKNALKHHHDRFCLQHGRMNNQCAVQGCERLAEHGYKTCIVPTHRAAEKGPRPSCLNCVPDSVRSRYLNQSEPCAGHSPGISEKKLKVNLRRRWTHNEQLFVRCCGIITSRATFFGSEGISGVKVYFLKVTFPACYPGAMPSYIFYDNNCRLIAHLLHTGDTYFSNVGLPVDVFHFKSKHKETDIIC